MRIADIIEQIEQFAPLSLQEDFDNSGLQVGDTEQVATAALLTLDITEAVVDEAIEKNCNLIISHHPLLFRGLKRVSNSSWIERIVVRAVKNNLVLYAAHTNLDKCLGGVNYEMARLIGLENVRVLMPESGDSQTGLGCVGELSAQEDCAEFLARLKRVFGVQCLRHSPLLQTPVRRVALCSGSGSEFIDEAKRAKADVYVTADVSYHKFFDADNEIVIADIGHFESEQIIKNLFYARLSKIFPNFAVWKAESDLNVVKYM